MPVISKSKKKRILSLVMDFIRAEGLEPSDDFPIRASQVYLSWVEENSRIPDEETFIREMNKIKTDFFRINTTTTKRRLLVDLLTRLNYEFEPVLKEIKRKAKISKSSDISTSCERVYVDDIDSFRKVRNVNPKAVKDFVPVKMSERKLKESLASIIGEKFIPEDWGGERSDLYSSRIILRGKRISTAFLLKGPSVRKLTIDKCGKRGNQVLRLMTEPAELFVVQHVGEIDTDVIKLLETCVSNLSGSKNMKLYYCVIDGTDTARILFAYSKLSIS